jgi:AcrR family transcriptional regulator
MHDAAVVKKKRTPSSSAAPRVSPELRERILQGAATAIGAHGYANARVEDILQAAGVSRPTFYKVFDSKEDVFKELSARHHAEIRERIQRASAAEDPRQRLIDTTEAFLRWRAELGPIGRVLDTEARTPGTVIAHHRKRTLRDMLELHAENVRRAGLPEVDPVLLLALSAALESVADSLLLEGPVDEATIQRALHNGLRILGGTFAEQGDYPNLPPLPVAPKPVKPSKARVSRASRAG